MLKIQKTTASPAETVAFAEQVGKRLHAGDVIAYFGGLGVGKTTFTRGLAKGMGLPDVVSSPTFAVVHEYEGGVLPVYHFDMYRISDAEDLYSCGFYDYLGCGILALEWSENIVEALPEDFIKIEISRGNADNVRKFVVEGADTE